MPRPDMRSDMHQDRRRAAERRGRRAELLAAAILVLKGYRLLARRWRCAAGEVDLIARKGRLLVFVEVKARPSHLEGLDSVTYTSRRRIERSAEIFARQRRLTPFPPFRFDIVTVSGLKWVHRRDAWRSGE